MKYVLLNVNCFFWGMLIGMLSLLLGFYHILIGIYIKRCNDSLTKLGGWIIGFD